MKRKITIGICIVMVLIVIRESGLVQINFYRTKTETSMSGIKIDRIKNPEDKFDDFKIYPSMLDYVPFYKKRKIQGVLGARYTGRRIEDAVKYEVKIETIGICSGYEFRRMIKTELDKMINRRYL